MQNFAANLVKVTLGSTAKFIVVSGAGVGGSEDQVSPLLKTFFRVTSIGRAYDDMNNMENILIQSELDLYRVRPTTLTFGRLTKMDRQCNY